MDFRHESRAVTGLPDSSGTASKPASRPTEPPAALPRRKWLAIGLASATALALQACSVAPMRAGRGSSDVGSEDLEEPDDLDLLAAGAGSEIVMQALANVGKPYRWGGSNPADGFDCSGLVAHVYDDAIGVKLPRTSQQMSRRGTDVGRSGLAAGDLVFFNTSRRAYSHVGIYIGRGRFVHAPSPGSLVRVERMSNRYWASRFNGARRLVVGNASNAGHSGTAANRGNAGSGDRGG
jgi:cell wall-associated NlpC family hydrolase